MNIGIIAALAALSISAPAMARTAEETLPTRSVSMAGLDLASAQGQHRAKRRLTYAIEQVCDNNDPDAMIRSDEFLRCRDKAWAQADQQLDIQIALAGARHGIALASR